MLDVKKLDKLNEEYYAQLDKELKEIKKKQVEVEAKAKAAVPSPAPKSRFKLIPDDFWADSQPIDSEETLKRLQERRDKPMTLGKPGVPTYIEDPTESKKRIKKKQAAAKAKPEVAIPPPAPKSRFKLIPDDFFEPSMNPEETLKKLQANRDKPWTFEKPDAPTYIEEQKPKTHDLYWRLVNSIKWTDAALTRLVQKGEMAFSGSNEPMLYVQKEGFATTGDDTSDSIIDSLALVVGNIARMVLVDKMVGPAIEALPVIVASSPKAAAAISRLPAILKGPAAKTIGHAAIKAGALETLSPDPSIKRGLENTAFFAGTGIGHVLGHGAAQQIAPYNPVVRNIISNIGAGAVGAAATFPFSEKKGMEWVKEAAPQALAVTILGMVMGSLGNKPAPDQFVRDLGKLSALERNYQVALQKGDAKAANRASKEFHALYKYNIEPAMRRMKIQIPQGLKEALAKKVPTSKITPADVAKEVKLVERGALTTRTQPQAPASPVSVSIPTQDKSIIPPIKKPPTSEITTPILPEPPTQLVEIPPSTTQTQIVDAPKTKTTKKSTPTPPKADELPQVGDKIKFKYGQLRRTGKIVSVSNNTFMVEQDDTGLQVAVDKRDIIDKLDVGGDAQPTPQAERPVEQPEAVTPPTPPKADELPQVGDRVTALGKTGVVERFTGGLYHIRLDDTGTLMPVGKNHVKKLDAGAEVSTVPVETPKKEMPIKVSAEDIPYETARIAYIWNSMDPERRARQEQQQYLKKMENVYEELSPLAETPEQKELLVSEIERYKEGLIKRTLGLLNARSKTANPMVTGPAKFPTARNQKALEREQRLIEEFLAWDKKAISSIKKKLRGAMTEEQVGDKEFARLKKEVDNIVDTFKRIENGEVRGIDKALIKANFSEKLTRSLRNGHVSAVEQALTYLKELEAKELKKPIFTKIHSIWRKLEKAKQKAAEIPESTEPQQVIAEFKGVKVIRNLEADRVQMRFDGKPDENLRKDLKASGWRWSPAGNVWQRKLTPNAESNAIKILGKHFEGITPTVKPEVQKEPAEVKEVEEPITPTEEKVRPEELLVEDKLSVGKHPIVSLPPEQIKIDPDRFQFKLMVDRHGTTQALKDVEKWDDIRAGIITAWQDKSGQYWVVNGHHRLALANRLNAKNPGTVNRMLVVVLKESDGYSAEEARKIGALQNIGEGRGTAVDFAKFLRDIDGDREDLKREGISVTESKIENALALKGLSDFFFTQVARGHLPEAIGVAIGKELPGDEVAQKAVVDLVARQEAKGRKISGSVLEEIIKSVKAADTSTETQTTLFGEEIIQKSNAIEKAEIIDYVKKQFRTQKRVFKTASKESLAKILESAGNILKTEKNVEFASQADAALALVDRLAHYKDNPISQILNKHANIVADGGNATQAKQAAFNEIVSVIERGDLLERNQGTEKEKASIDTSTATFDFQGTPEKDKGTGKKGKAKETISGASASISFSVPTATNGQKTNPVKRIALINYIEKEFLLPIREGRMTLKKAAGEYKVREEVTRLKRAEDLPVIAHEFGHHLTKTLQLPYNQYPELLPLGAAIYPKYTAKRQREEGLAEFFRLYFTNPIEAEEKAPTFYSDFEQKLDKEPGIKAKIKELQDLYKRYYAQDAVEHIKSHIVREQPKGDRPFLSKKEQLYADLVDDLHPIYKAMTELVGEENVKTLSVLKNPYILARLARASSRAAHAMLTHGMVDPDLNVIGPSYKKILEPVRKDIENWTAYIVAKRAVELEKRGKKTGFDKEKAEEAVRQLETPLFKEVAAQRQAFKDNLLNWLADSGVLSEEQVVLIKELNENHVPFYRVFGEERQGRRGAGKGYADISSPIKKIKGSTRSIWDPIQSDVQDTYFIMDIAKRNAVGVALANLADKAEGMGGLIEKVPTPMEANKIELERLRKDLVDAGIHKAVLNMADLERIAVVFNPVRFARHKEARENILTVRRGGKVEFYQVHPELYRALKALDVQAGHWLIRLLGSFTRVFKAGVLSSPDFALRNIARDTGTRALVTKGAVWQIPKALLQGVYHVALKTEKYTEAEVAGALQAGQVVLNRDALKNHAHWIIGDKTLKEQTAAILRSPLTFLEWLLEISEEMSRLGEYLTVTEAEGGDSREAKLEGAYAAREGGLDFQRAGYKSREVNKIVAFFNATIQGIDKLARDFREDPVRFLIRGSLFSLISLVFYMANRKNKQYEEEPRWRKDLYWIHYKKDETPVYLPKPHEAGILFGSTLERSLEWMEKKNPEAMKELAESVTESLAPSIIPVAFLPWMEVWANRNLFTGRPIVPMAEQSLPAKYQYGPRTSETSKAIGGVLNVSPRKLDSLVRGYTGTMGTHALDLIDVMAGKAGTKKTAEELTPGLRAFTGAPYVSAKSVDKYYEELNKLQQQTNAYNKGFTKKRPDTARLNRLKLFKGRIDKYRKDIKKIEASNIPAEQKRKRINELNKKIVNAARLALNKSPLD